MQKRLKKSVMSVYSIISTFLTFVPVTYAATTTLPTQDVVAAIGMALGLAFGIVGGIIQVILDLFQQDPIYAKAFIAIFMGIYFYTALKELPALKGNTKSAGMIAFLIALITAYAVPVNITKNIFSSSSPFFVFIVCAFILTVFRHDSRVAHFAKGIAYLALTVLFTSFFLEFQENVVMQIIISGFIVLTIILFIYNFFKSGQKLGPDLGWGKKNNNEHKKGLWDRIFGNKGEDEETEELNQPRPQGGQQPQLGNQSMRDPQKFEQLKNKINNKARTVAAGTQATLNQVHQLEGVHP
ncbi:MAG: hypothetical protein PHF86_10720 [Candidatus Nanoarchaeia archaeon]|nr:hypothetical protein [Candidatus Nanoarchaeia archaeon]